MNSATPPAVDQKPDYQGAVRRLTAENKRLRQELADQAHAHKKEIRKLEAQLRERLTPEITVLRRELRRWRDRAVAAESRLANLRRGVA